MLKGINLTFEKGKTIALVGPSGGGKSTMIDLIPRFYDPYEGTVKVEYSVPLLVDDPFTTLSELSKVPFLL